MILSRVGDRPTATILQVQFHFFLIFAQFFEQNIRPKYAPPGGEVLLEAPRFARPFDLKQFAFVARAADNGSENQLREMKALISERLGAKDPMELSMEFPLQSDCLIAKVDGPGQVDLLRSFGKIWPPIFIYFHIFLYTDKTSLKADREVGRGGEDRLLSVEFCI